MTTVINNPGNAAAADEGAGIGLMVGIIVTVAVAAVLFYLYVMPNIKTTPAAPTTTTVKVELPKVVPSVTP